MAVFPKRDHRTPMWKKQYKARGINLLVTICIRGGSISAGHSVSRSYVQILSEDEKIRKHSIYNISDSGDTSFQGVWGFDKILVCRPDLLILHFGIDDIYYPVYRSEFKENLVRMVQKARAASIPQIILPTLHLVDNPYEMETVSVYTRTVREVALDMNCLLATVHIEWFDYLERTGNPVNSLLGDDERYPNENGHELIAQAIKKKLLTVLT